LEDKLLTVQDMSVINGASLAGYLDLVRSLDGNTERLLDGAGLRLEEVGNRDVFVSYLAMVTAVEMAARATRTPDFGRRLALRQGIEILGPVGVAARTSATVADALEIFRTYLSAFSTAIESEILATARPEESRFVFRIVAHGIPPCPQVIELALGVALRIFRFMLGPTYAPQRVYLPHAALTDRADYVDYYGAPVRFSESFAGFAIKSVDLSKPLDQDQLAHEALVSYLRTLVSGRDLGIAASVRELTTRLLPTGHTNLETVSLHFRLHPKTLQRRLADDGTTFTELLDVIRRDSAHQLLADTNLSLAHVSRMLGYSEQSTLNRSCLRWFGTTPADVRDNRLADGRTSSEHRP